MKKQKSLKKQKQPRQKEDLDILLGKWFGLSRPDSVSLCLAHSVLWFSVPTGDSRLVCELVDKLPLIVGKIQDLGCEEIGIHTCDGTIFKSTVSAQLEKSKKQRTR